MKIFLSHSGQQSQAIAKAFSVWLPRVIQAVKPWFSSDIEKGAKWANELDNALAGTRFGIVFLTPDNLENPWIHYEAGALSKTEGARVWTFLHVLSPSDVAPPLSSFQATTSEKSEVLKLLQSINERLKESSGEPLPEAILKDVFEDAWPKLERQLEQAQSIVPQADQREIRADRELLEEILDLVRGYQGQVDQMKYAIIEPNYFNRIQRLGLARSAKDILGAADSTAFVGNLPPDYQDDIDVLSIEPGREVEAILKVLQKMNRGLILTALEDAQSLQYRDGTLYIDFSDDDVFAKRVRDSGDLFRDVGLRLFGRHLQAVIQIIPKAPAD